MNQYVIGDATITQLDDDRVARVERLDMLNRDLEGASKLGFNGYFAILDIGYVAKNSRTVN